MVWAPRISAAAGVLNAETTKVTTSTVVVTHAANRGPRASTCTWPVSVDIELLLKGMDSSDGKVLAMPDPRFGGPDDAAGLRRVILGFQFGDPGQQRLQADPDEVGQCGVPAVPAVAADGLPGNPDDHGAARHL